jgi:acyl-[acyl-carrier-protein]-phospholipid O-acyltransferase/long-chain-fatty-acid--[acyl-carrier-protein] ligase
MDKKILLKNPGFKFYVATQFFGAFNDNAYKFTIQLILISGLAATTGQGRYLGITVALFTAPFLLFSTYAGYLADRFSKQRVIQFLKILEIVVMVFGAIAFYLGDISIIYWVLFLMGTQSALFSPAKYGILPEMLHDRDLSKANGIVQMATYVAIILGTMAGGFIVENFEPNLPLGSLFFIGIALVGSVTAIWVPHVDPSPSQKKFEINPFTSFYRNCREVFQHRKLAYTILGIAYFFFLASVLQLMLILYGKNMLYFSPKENGLFQGVLALGIGLGSLLAGRLSGEKIELRLVPLGAIIISLFCIDLALFATDTWRAVFDVMMLSLGGGLYNVPQNALLQQQSPSDKKGQYIGCSNTISFAGVFLASFVVWGLLDILRLDPAQSIMVMGGLTLFGTLFFMRLILGKQDAI